MLRAYHLTTEREKGVRVDGPGDLPAPYRSEIEDAGPGTGALLLLDDGGAAAGMYVLAPTADPATGEVKRLWIEPAWRGRGLGRFAIDDAIQRSSGPARPA
jgi:GNAT superfamily N-acetyltransferase